MPANSRLSLVLGNDLNEVLIELRKTDEFCQCSFGEIIRRIMEEGLEARGIDIKKGD